jgi:hypothetical protein
MRCGKWTMPEPLRSTQGALEAHWNTLANQLAAELDQRSHGIVIKADPIETAIVARVAGGSTRLATRLPGQRVTVVPLREISTRWDAWIGYREVWESAKLKQYSFSSADITIFLSPHSAEAFQQILRAEWVGLTEDDLGDWIFRPSDAGHPHWQVDIVDCIRTDREVATALSLLKETSPREFEPEGFSSGSIPPPYLNLGRMHLAASMRPWSDLEIAHGPACLADVRGWVVHATRILGRELARLA